MANQPRIERLQFTNFRGATRPITFQFQANQPIVLIFGENGTGKSTIADALDFLCNNDFGSLRLRSGTTPRTHIVAAQGQAKDLAVEMVYGGQRWHATLQGGKPVTSPAQPPRAFVLRRADITRIMEATDSDRYKALQEFITVPQVESAEGNLRTLCKTVAAEVDQAIQQKGVAESTLQQFWEAEGQPADDYLTWARSAVQKPITALRQQIAVDRQLLNALDEAARAQEALRAATLALQQSRAAQTDLETQLQAANQRQPNADIITTLQAAQQYLRNHPNVQHCPVCAKAESQATLLAQIDNQLTQLQQIQRLRQQVEQQARTVQQAEGALKAAQGSWGAAYTAVVALLPTAPPGFAANITMTPEASHPDAQTTVQRLFANRNLLAQRIAHAEKVVNQHNALTTHLTTIDQLTEVMLSKYDLAQQLQQMLAIVEQERKAYVEATITAISSSVSQLYARIHPGEALGKPTFGLKKKTVGSLTLTSAFGSNLEAPPAAYYSESHLDTLGLCVYLALAKTAGNALVVLDDVLTSVDEPHLDRVIDLLNEEAPHFGHVIITTHSRAWFDRIRLGQGMPAELVELYGWNLQHGMNHSAAPLAVDELRAAVEAPKLERQLVASRAGNLLEQLLDELTLRFGCALPRKRPAHYTLGELSQGFDKTLRKLLRTDQFDPEGEIFDSHELYPLISAAAADTWIRNQVGAHFNPNGAGISDAMVRQFGERVLHLADALLCPHCRQLPRKNKSGSYWECGGGCGKIRLYPLQAP